MNANLKFYSKGLAFDCTACGKCCTNHSSYTYVYLTDQDLKEIPRFLGISRSSFLTKYSRSKQGHRVLQDKGENCVFLKKDGKCQVYSARPLQCRTFPFWPENMNKKTWAEEIQRDCPGTNAKTNVTPERIKEFLSWEEQECYPTGS